MSTDLYQEQFGTILNPRKENRRKEDQQRDEKIKICTCSLKEEKMTVLDFLMLMADQNVKTLSDGRYLISNNQHIILIFSN